MTTKIPVELSSTPGIVDGSNATAITIDSNEKVGINNTTPGNSYSLANTLVVGDGSTNEGITIFTGTSNTGAFHFADGAGGGDAANTYAGYISYDHANDRMKLGAGSSDRVRISTDGLLFGTDTAADNALKDYEQGAWTPVAGGVTTSVSFAYYTKIGNLVYAQFYINFVPANNGSQFQITGLPYSSTRGYAGGSLGYVASVNMSDILSPIVNSNGTFIYFHKNNADGSSVSNANLYSKSSGRHYLLGTVIYQHG